MKLFSASLAGLALAAPRRRARDRPHRALGRGPLPAERTLRRGRRAGACTMSRWRRRARRTARCCSCTAPPAPPAIPIAALGERLARRFRVIAVDRPGSGWSDRIGAEASSPAVQARIIRESSTGSGSSAPWSSAIPGRARSRPTSRSTMPSGRPGLVLLSPVTHPWPGGGISWYYTPIDLAGGRPAPALDARDAGRARAHGPDGRLRLRAAGAARGLRRARAHPARASAARLSGRTRRTCRAATSS